MNDNVSARPADFPGSAGRQPLAFLYAWTPIEVILRFEVPEFFGLTRVTHGTSKLASV